MADRDKTIATGRQLWRLNLEGLLAVRDGQQPLKASEAHMLLQAKLGGDPDSTDSTDSTERFIGGLVGLPDSTSEAQR